MTVSLPKLKVEIGWGGTPFVPTFTDVTTDYRVYSGCPIEYGRADNKAQPKTATATFILDNPSGKYTMDNTGSAFYPNVRRGRAVRISATEDGVTYYPRYYGFIDTIMVVWDDATGLMAGTQITCVDLLSLLSTVKLDANLVELYMNGGGLQDYWPLDDPAGTVQPRNIHTAAGGQKVRRFLDDTTSAATAFGADGLPYDGTTSMTLKDAQYGAQNAPTSVYNIAAHGISAMGFFKFDGLLTTDQPSVLVFQDIATGSVCLSVDIVAGVPRADMNELGLPGGTIVQNLSSGVRVDDGQWHHFGIAYQSGAGGTLRLSVDGVELINVVGIGASVSANGYGWWALAFTPISGTGGTMELAHVAAADGNTSAVTFAALANAGLAGCAGDDSGERIARLALLWSGSVIIPTIIGTPGTQNMAPLVSVAGSNILDMMLDVMKTENGWLYVDRSGVLTMRSRLARYNQSAALTLPSESYDPAILFVQDRSLYINDETATAYGSTNPQEVIAASASSDWSAPDETSLLTRDDTEALAFAQWIVGTGLPITRSPEIAIDGMTQQVTFPGLLVAFWQLDLGELLAVQSLPAAAPATNLNYLTEGIKENLTDKGYPLTIMTSPPPASGAWILQDAVLGLLGSTTYLAY